MTEPARDLDNGDVLAINVAGREVLVRCVRHQGRLRAFVDAPPGVSVRFVRWSRSGTIIDPASHVSLIERLARELNSKRRRSAGYHARQEAYEEAAGLRPDAEEPVDRRHENPAVVTMPGSTPRHGPPVRRREGGVS